LTHRFLTPNSPSAGYICRTLKIPNGEEFWAAVNGVLLELTYASNWEEFGSLTPEQTAELFTSMFDYYRESRGCLIGTIFAHALASAPIGSLPCDGSSFLRADYPDLYDALDTAYHVDATHGRCPNLRGRDIVGTGQGAGLTNRSIDGAGGSETHQLSVAEMPSHFHYSLYPTALPIALPGEPIFAISGVPYNQPTSSTGGDGAHNNMPPFRALHYAIWAR